MTNPTPGTLSDMQAQLAAFEHQIYLTGVRVPELFSEDFILELSVEIYGDAVEALSDEQLAAIDADDGLDFTLEEAEALLNAQDDDSEELKFPIQRWDILAQGVQAQQFELGLDVTPSLSTDAPPLQRARMPQVTLMYAAAPASEHDLLAGLFAVHDRTLWGEFGKYGLGADLRFGCGWFAEGPKPLLDAYAEVLEKHAMRPSFMNIPAEELGTPPSACLLLDEEGKSFILADDFQVLRRAEEDTEL